MKGKKKKEAQNHPQTQSTTKHTELVSNHSIQLPKQKLYKNEK
jgi:hypothetical protein